MLDNSIKNMLLNSVQIKSCLSQDGGGDKSFGLPVDTLCYRSGETKTIRTVKGEEVVCIETLYFDGTVVISKNDHLVIDGDEFPIVRLQPFFKDGVRDLLEVNL